MRRFLVRVGAALILISSTAVAQIMPDMATDQELFAGYCLGVAVQTRATELVTGDAALDTSIKRADEEFVEKFRTYLMARGLLSGARSTVAINGVILARKRGERDELICSARIDMCVRQCSLPGRLCMS